jgi:hypothetical protein
MNENQARACEISMSDSGPRYVVSLGDVTAALKRIPLAMLGAFVKDKQRFSVTRKTLADLVANFRRRLADTVIDYEHASEFPGDARGQPIPAAGWLKAIEDGPDADGVLYGEAEFTPRAQALIEGKEYRYLSPVINWGARDKQTGEPQGATLTSLALTNRPFLEALPALAMSDGWGKIDADGDGRGTSSHTKENTMPTLEQTENLLLSMVEAERKECPNLPYHEALKLVARENRPLSRAYQELAERRIVGSDDDTRESTARALDAAESILLSMVEAKRKECPNLQYHEALKLVAGENRPLAQAYRELIQRKNLGQ